MPSHEPDELRRMHETIDTYYPKTYLDCWAAVCKPMFMNDTLSFILFHSIECEWPLKEIGIYVLQHVRTDWAEFLDRVFLSDVILHLGESGGSVLDLGSGPSISSIIAASRCFA